MRNCATLWQISKLIHRSCNDNGLSFLDRDGNAFIDDQADNSDSDDEYFPDENNDYVEDELFSDDESVTSTAQECLMHPISTSQE
eukprot:scaffold95216_cov68-Attheya_sp.AAC.6